MRDRIWCTQVNRVAKVPLPPRARFTHKHNASLSPGKRGGGERGQGVCVHKRERCVYTRERGAKAELQGVCADRARKPAL